MDRINMRILETIFSGMPHVLGPRIRIKDNYADILFGASIIWMLRMDRNLRITRPYRACVGQRGCLGVWGICLRLRESFC